MNDVPHFLRVVRALAGVKGPLPVIAAITTVVAGISCACDGFCGPSTPECTSDTDCSKGEVCWGEYCVALSGTPCKADTDCRTGELCDTAAGACSSRDGPCRADSDCIAGDICESGVCILGCGEGFTCPTGKWCDPKTSRCANL